MMSSPGIRALNIARVLSRHLPGSRVVLAVPGTTDLVPDAPFEVVTYTTRSLPRLVLGYDVIISSGFPPTTLPAFYGARFVMDFFTNFMIEGLEYRREHVTPAVRQAWLDTQRVYLNLQLTMADFVVCSNDRQRDAWMGMMSCLGLIPGAVYDRDNTLHALVDTAAYGIRPDAPVARGPVLKGLIPGIGPEDTVLLWNGGILKWYDPVTLIHAVTRLAPRHPRLKLLFLGTTYPVAGFDPGATLDEAFAVAQGSGLLGTQILFNDGWLPYDVSGQHMVEADIGVSAYYDNLETHFSYRTRLIDFLWAGTPIICTKGDVIAEMVERGGLGITVPERDVDAMEAAVERLVTDGAFAARCRQNIAALRPELEWERTLQPLVEFCRQDAVTGGRASIARGKWWRTPDLMSRTARYAAARTWERWQTLRSPTPAQR